jgi:hypothetical protein
MILENIVPVGQPLFAAVSCNFHGFDLMRAVEGRLAQDNDGTVFLDVETERYDIWEIHMALAPGSEYEAELRALAHDVRPGVLPFDMDRAVRAIYREVYEEGIGNPEAIHKGVWSDVPHQLGFSDRAGIYLVHPGSNSSYGNYSGGFPSTQAAVAYRARYQLSDTWQTADRRGPQPDDEVRDPSGNLLVSRR